MPDHLLVTCASSLKSDRTAFAPVRKISTENSKFEKIDRRLSPEKRLNSLMYKLKAYKTTLIQWHTACA